MRVEILGCSGGISGELRTMSLWVDHDILIDAGTGVGDLGLQQMVAVDDVFLTHAHLDHCACLSLLADATGHFRRAPLAVHALPETIEVLRQNIFNGKIWPDYTVLPSPERPYLVFKPLQPGETMELNGRKITPLPARHAVPAVGYRLDNGEASFVYSGDTTFCEDFWLALQHMENLKYLMVETTFLNANAAGAERSGHMTPDLLAQGMRLLERPVELFVAHIEPGRESETMREVLHAAGEFGPVMMRRGQVFLL